MAVNDTPFSGKATLADRPVLTITVTNGPDRRKAVRFDQPRILLGRKPENDMVLKDFFVSGEHGVFERTGTGFIFRDLGSSHGTFFSLTQDDTAAFSVEPDQSIALRPSCFLRIGATLLFLRVETVYGSSTESGASRMTVTQGESERLMASQGVEEAFHSQFLNSSPRVQALFNLAGRLNALSNLDDILNLVADSIFQGLPQADLFSITLLPNGEPQPLTVRFRDGTEQPDQEIVISRSTLKKVAATDNAHLVIRGESTIAPTQSMVDGDISSCLCAPLRGQQKLIGVIMVDSRGGGRFTKGDLDWFCVLASSVAFAFERVQLTKNIYRMFEGFVEASVKAIEARDPATAGHSERVAKYALSLAEAVNDCSIGPLAPRHFSPAEMTELRYAALLHDFGKLGVDERILKKSSRLSDAGMEKVRHRFEKAILLNHFFDKKRLIEHAITKQCLPAGDVLAAMTEQTSASMDRMRRELAVIDQLRSKWKLNEEEVRQLQLIGSRKFHDEQGKSHPMLTVEELSNLTQSDGTLNDMEWAEMKRHVEYTEAFLSHIPWSEDLRDVPCIAAAHHEKLDGSGYPYGLKAEKLSTRARILTIADIFDAATSWDRPYCEPISVEEAANLLQFQVTEGKLDNHLVRLFITMVLPNFRHIVPHSVS